MFLSNSIKMSIPVYNILNAVALICASDLMYKNMKKSLLQENKIYKVEYNGKIDVEVEVNSKQEELNCTYREIKKFDELTREEKLEFLNSERGKLYQSEQQDSQNSFQYFKRRK